MATKVKDDQAMRLTCLGQRLGLSVSAMVVMAAAGCQRLPYIDFRKPVPHDAMGKIAQEDREVQQASFNEPERPPLPKVAPPRTTENPEAQEIWKVTLEEAIKIALDNAEVVRLIPLGAQGIPIQGFEPDAGRGTGDPGTVGGPSFTTVYDPAIAESRISSELARFDANFSTSLFWGRNVTPVNNAISAGVFGGPRFPVLFNQETAQFAATLQKRAATGTVMQFQQNVNWLYSNSPVNVYPSVYNSNVQFRFVHPLLGGTAQEPSGLEANRAPIVIARLQSDSNVWNFKSEIMQLVRSVEQQYWALAQLHVQLWSRETAVTLGEEILKRERAEQNVGKGTIADVAEAQQNLERFRLDLVSATSDVINAERQLRNIMGLPPSDNRRIVPATAPTESRVQPDWDASLAQMVSFHPLLVVHQLRVRQAELQLLLARNALLPQLNLDALYQLNGLGKDLDRSLAVMTGTQLDSIDPLIAEKQRDAGVNVRPGAYKNFETWQVGFTFEMPIGFRGPLAQTRVAQYSLLKERAALQQAVHQNTHSLARYFLEIDANFKLLKTAGRLRESAKKRLEVQKARYEVGEINIDRYLDAVSQWANAVAEEARYKTAYNTAIAILEEAKGTLLAYNNIALAEGPYPRKAYMQARDQQTSHHQVPVPTDGTLYPPLRTGPRVPDPVQPVAPPGANPGPMMLPLPAPAGPVGPPSTPAGPSRPAGAPNILSQNTGQDAPPPPLPLPISNLPGAMSQVPATAANSKPAAAPAPALARTPNGGSVEPLPPAPVLPEVIPVSVPSGDGQRMQPLPLPPLP